MVTATGALPKFRLEVDRLAAAPVPPPVMVIVTVPFPVPLVLVALSVTVDVAATVGVPEISPVAVFTVKPAGNPVAP